MGYDFILFRMRQKPASCPSRMPPDFGAESVIPIDDPVPLHDAVRASPVFAPDTVTFDGPRLVWHTPDGGTLDVRVMAQGINIDTHAHWDHVAQVFDLASTIWPETALFDLQAALVHDAASFRAFVVRTYRDTPGTREAAPDD